MILYFLRSLQYLETVLGLHCRISVQSYGNSNKRKLWPSCFQVIQNVFAGLWGFNMFSTSRRTLRFQWAHLILLTLKQICKIVVRNVRGRCRGHLAFFWQTSLLCREPWDGVACVLVAAAAEPATRTLHRMWRGGQKREEVSFLMRRGGGERQRSGRVVRAHRENLAHSVQVAPSACDFRNPSMIRHPDLFSIRMKVGD